MEEEEQQPSTDAEDAEYTTEDTDNDADTISNADKSTSAMDGNDWANKTKTKKKKKRKRKGKKKGVKKGDEEEKKYACDPVVYSPCPHLHFKAEVIEREVLTREQHLMLLSTPRGYRWEPERSPRYCTRKKRRRKVGGSGDANVKNAGKTDRTGRIRPAEKHIEKCDEKYVGRFLGEIWNYLPPDMVDNLKKLLVEEFGMTEKEAEDFIKKQGEQGASSLEKDPQQKPELVPSVRTGARYKWVKDFSKIFANKMADYIIMLLSAKRTPRVRKLAEAILKHFADVTGEKVTLRKADTRLQKIMVFIADRIAIWLDSIMKEAQTADTADKAVEVKLQTDGGEDGDKRQPKKKKKKEEEEEEEEVEEEKVEEEEEKEFKSAKSSQKSSKTASKEPSKEPSKESSKEASKTASKASSKASTKSKESSKEKVEEEQKAEEEEEEKGAAEEEEEKVKEEEEAVAGDAVEEEAKGVEGGEEEAVEEEQEEAQGEAQEEVQEEAQEEAQEEEPQQDEQAEDIKQVLEDQLTDPETAEKLSAIISNILKETDDLVKPPLPPLIPPGALRKKSFVYQIARQDGSVYNIRQLSSQTVAEKVAEARSREKPPRKAPGLFERPNSLSPMNLKNMADWSRWAIEVADIAEDWTKWINQTVATAELASNAEKERLRVREENEGGGGGRTSKEERPFTKQNWKDWQARIQEQADDFRKIKKELKRSGSEWSKKAELGGAGGGGSEEGGADRGGEDEEKETGVITYDEGKQEEEEGKKEEEEGKTEEKAEEEAKEGEGGEEVVEKTEEE
ncbi:hypothetical protein LSTR_LSTR011081 [Laodelphax striatellus]|uniref:Uncharacterized protein n=1 Tax=Laodelphax striatellus TaxID=195883 RepID=A0A482WVM3_LAOST|nr:hypothetical protein LSTR_LSTR011081 [Laodelphax striatellus]